MPIPANYFYGVAGCLWLLLRQGQFTLINDHTSLSRKEKQIMTTDTQNQNSVNSKRKWKVQLADGTRIGWLTSKDIADGLRTGWLRPNDSVQSQAGPWLELNNMGAQLGFDVAVCLDPQKAFREQYGFGGALLLAPVSVAAAWYLRFLLLPDLSLPARLVLATGCLVLFLFVTFSPWHVPGLLSKLFVTMLGLSMLAGMVGVDARALASFVFSLPTFLYLVVLGGLGGLIGWGVGSVLGALVGKRQAPIYKLPVERTSYPTPQPDLAQL